MQFGLLVLFAGAASGLIVQQRQELEQPILSWARKALSSKCFTKQYDFQVTRPDLLQLLWSLLEPELDLDPPNP